MSLPGAVAEACAMEPQELGESASDFARPKAPPAERVGKQVSISSKSSSIIADIHSETGNQKAESESSEEGLQPVQSMFSDCNSPRQRRADSLAARLNNLNNNASLLGLPTIKSSTTFYVDKVILGEMGGGNVSDMNSSDYEDDAPTPTPSRLSRLSNSMFAEPEPREVRGVPEIPLRDDLRHDTHVKRKRDAAFQVALQDLWQMPLLQRRKWATTIIENSAFVVFYVLLTIYALYASDVDLTLGNKVSKVAVSWCTTAVAMLFVLELLLQMAGKKGYICRAYFWLDVVALISLIPDTVLVDVLLSNSNSFIAGRASRLTRMIRLAARSSRVMRLNRLTRVARVVVMLPRFLKVLGFGHDPQLLRMLHRKLEQIFYVLDTDFDGFVEVEIGQKAIDRLGVQVECELNFLEKAKARLDRLQIQSSVQSAAVSSRLPTAPRTPSGEAHARELRRSDTSSASKIQDDEGKISMADFKAMILQDPILVAGLLKQISQAQRSGNSAQVVSSKSSEYIGVKVALCVLFLLFLITYVDHTVEDTSLAAGLQTLDFLGKSRYPNASSGTVIPNQILEQIKVWVAGNDDYNVLPRTLVYLDINKKVVCNQIFVSAGCTFSQNSTYVWTDRISFSDIDTALLQSNLRKDDINVVLHPDLMANEDLSMGQYESLTTSVAVFNDRLGTTEQAKVSVETTSAIIIIILVGITVLTRDIGILSKSLLQPLVDLADDIESITRLQLAGILTSEDSPSDLSAKTSEIRLMRESFESMKKGIKSWGKYVPWPVVQLLLRKDISATDLTEREVTIFFSDIASFTTIVESLPPASCLLLLSRYFYDMSQLIDDYNGIVLEFIGDAIMSIYGAPISNPDHAMFGVKSAVRMLEALSDVNKFLQVRGMPEVKIRCGVHTGKVLVGMMGFASRMKYGVVGEESHIPGRLEEMNKVYSTCCLISKATYSRLHPKSFFMRPVDYVCLAEDDGQVDPVYEVMGRDWADPNDLAAPVYRRCASMHTEALLAYRMKDFHTAAEKFEAVGALMRTVTNTEDKASAVMARRCFAYVAAPPATDWSGVWDRG